MSTVSGERGRGPQGTAARLAAVPLRWLGVSAGAVALVVSGLFGGLDDAQRPGPRTVAVGAVDRGDPWNVSVNRIRLLNDLPPLKPETEGNRWIGVVATIEITADESRNDLRDILRLDGAEGLADEKPTHVMLLRDATRLGYLNPGMPEEVAFVWEQAASAPVPTELTVQIYGKTYRLDTLGNRMAWMGEAEPRAQVVAPVQDRRT